MFKTKAMADVDESEFGSLFLDSMLEVEMTEEDSELDMSKNYDPLDSLPSTPTFDLQSETFPYKDVYRTPITQPVITLPLGAPKSTNVIMKPSSMLLYSGDTPTSKPASVLAPVQKIISRTQPKIPAKNISVSTVAKDTSDDRFLREVFRPEFVKNVFDKADSPQDISCVSEEEMKYYKSCFKDVSKVQKCRLHCTICDKHLGCAVTAEDKINVHSMLKVLTCKPCFEFYGDGNFPCDTGDNCEIYCRWCGQGGALVCCSFCPRVFCKRCVKRNFGTLFLKSVEKATDWACFCCAQKPLWPHRAVCRALLEFIAKKKTEPVSPPRDTTSCCKVAGLTRKRLRQSVEKPKCQVSQMRVGPTSRASDPKNKISSTVKTEKPQLPMKAAVRLKATGRVKIPVNSNENSKPSAITSIFSPKSITGNSIFRGVTTGSPTKLFSSFPSPRLIQSPVLHGETLITPPSRLLAPTKPSPAPSNNSSFVRVSLTHQSPNIDMNKIPTVKIPHEVQGLILRLIFPDNKMHYVRLTSDGSGCKASKGFPMPHFKEKGASFVEENLAEAFKISKMMYEKLLRIRDKVHSRTRFTEESVFNSSVKKLHTVYEKTLDLFRELDKTLLENHEEWKTQLKNSVDVIDLSDDEATTVNVKKNKPNRYSSIREKCKKLSDDSDIEILDDIVVNGKTPPSGNYKEKYRLKSGANQALPSSNGNVKKRKKGRPRKHNKRLKGVKMENGQPEEDPLKTDTEADTTTGTSPVHLGSPRDAADSEGHSSREIETVLCEPSYESYEERESGQERDSRNEVVSTETIDRGGGTEDEREIPNGEPQNPLENS